MRRALAVALLLAACRAAPERADAGPADAPADAAVEAEPAQPTAIPVQSATATSGGADVALSLSSETPVAPDAHFKIELAANLPDVRLSLLDEQDAVVPCTGTSELARTARLT